VKDSEQKINPEIRANINGHNGHFDFNSILTYWNFDWDVNLVRMPSKIILFGLDKAIQLELSNEEWVSLRQWVGIAKSQLPVECQSGVPSNWHEFQIDTQKSYMRFRSTPGQNYFLEDLKQAVLMHPQEWQGHSWEAFLLALSQRDTAIRTSIISARGHNPIDVYEGLQFLQDFILRTSNKNIFLPLIENIHMVGQMASPSEEKARIMLQQIRLIESQPIDVRTPHVWDADGKSLRQLHLVGFSDDDYENYQKMLTTLSAAFANGEINRTKVTLFYTGGSHLQAEVITSRGELRPMLANEDREFKNIYLAFVSAIEKSEVVDTGVR
jgi:hypothetical protein